MVLFHLRQNLLGLQPHGGDTGHQTVERCVPTTATSRKCSGVTITFSARLAEQRTQGAGHLLTGRGKPAGRPPPRSAGFPAHTGESPQAWQYTTASRIPVSRFRAADGHGEDQDNQYHAHSSNDNDESGNQGAGIGKGAGNILIHRRSLAVIV